MAFEGVEEKPASEEKAKNRDYAAEDALAIFWQEERKRTHEHKKSTDYSIADALNHRVVGRANPEYWEDLAAISSSAGRGGALRSAFQLFQEVFAGRVGLFEAHELRMGRLCAGYGAAGTMRATWIWFSRMRVCAMS